LTSSIATETDSSPTFANAVTSLPLRSAPGLLQERHKGPILSVYPGLDQDMLPLALVVVILGGSGSLFGSFVGSFIVGVLYNFGQASFPSSPMSC